MRYVTDDGREFTDIIEAQEWESKLDSAAPIKAKVLSHLASLGLSGNNLARNVNIIVDWEMKRGGVLAEPQKKNK